FDLGDVARNLMDKLVRRHPHVFDAAEVADAAEVHARWEQIKAAERGRGSVLDGVPAASPALARAQKVLTRAARVGVGPLAEGQGPADPSAAQRGGIGARLLGLVVEAQRAGLDAEAELRGAVRHLEELVRAAERTP